MKNLLVVVLLPFVAALAMPASAVAQSVQRSTKPDETPFVFAGIKYSAPIDEALRRFGRPTRSESVVASDKLYWANDQLVVSFNKKTRRISGFTIRGPAGVDAVRRANDEPLLWLFTATQDELIKTLGKPGKIWYDNRRMSWDVEVDSKIQASIFFECLDGPSRPCSEMSVHWSGTAIWDPDDGVDALGVRVAPICAFTTNGTKIMARQLPTGITASNGQWEMELYENSETGSWTLIGKSTATRAPAGGRYCFLAQGSVARSYLDAKWYQAWFKR